MAQRGSQLGSAVPVASHPPRSFPDLGMFRDTPAKQSGGLVKKNLPWRHLREDFPIPAPGDNGGKEVGVILRIVPRFNQLLGIRTSAAGGERALCARAGPCSLPSCSPKGFCSLLQPSPRICAGRSAGNGSGQHRKAGISWGCSRGWGSDEPCTACACPRQKEPAGGCFSPEPVFQIPWHPSTALAACVILLRGCLVPREPLPLPFPSPLPLSAEILFICL